MNWEEYTIEQIQNAFDKGDLDSQQLVSWYLDRIEKIDEKGHALNSVLQLNSDAAETARRLDRERAEKGKRSPLHGIPVMIKGNIETADNMETTAGSLALAGHIAANDAPLVTALRESGAVILGKTNLSEWANFRSTRSSSGWSSLGGQTINPYGEDRSPCGSSSGSGAAVSANLCTVAVGTETDGSIVCPSHMNGIVGIKPTVGLISGRGIIPIAHSQDTAGPMARTVTDAVYLLDAMTGGNYAKALGNGSLKGIRIGVVRNLFGFREDIDALMEEALKLMKSGGADIIDGLELPNKDKYDEEELEVLLYEFKNDLNNYLKEAGTAVKSLAELILFNRKNSKTVMPWFEQEILEKAESKGTLEDEHYKRILEKCRRLSREEGIDRLVNDNSLKVLVAPTGGPAWKIDLINGDHYTGGGTSQPAAVAGYPHITVPAGFIKGLPAGLSFFGPANSERELIAAAYGYEKLRGKRVPPRL